MRKTKWLAPLAAAALGLAACGGGGGGGSGRIAIDGSSTVFPLAQAAAEEFRAQNPDVEVTVGASGTGGGFEKFCRGETDISNASRPIKRDEEVPICRRNGVSYKEIQVANDGIAVATNKALRIDCMTTDQLEELWATDRVKRYSDIDPRLPNQRVSLFGPGTDSGTFDFFTEEINGEEGRTRKDYQPSEDDNVLVQGVAGDPGGLGYFGFSYFEQNRDKLSLVGIDAGRGCVEPSTEAIQAGRYEPLSRPIFMYVSERALRRPQGKAFMDFLLENQRELAEAAQMVPMTPAQAQEGRRDLGG